MTAYSTFIWPPCPFRVGIPRRRGNQFILVTSNDRKDHGDKAKDLTLLVCDQMLEWLQKLPPATVISGRHWEQHSYGESHATEYSIFMSIDPQDTQAERHVGSLDREIAYFAMAEFRNLVELYGALEGVFEIWAYGRKLSTTTIHIFEWPLGYEKS